MSDISVDAAIEICIETLPGITDCPDTSPEKLDTYKNEAIQALLKEAPERFKEDLEDLLNRVSKVVSDITEKVQKEPNADVSDDWWLLASYSAELYQWKAIITKSTVNKLSSALSYMGAIALKAMGALGASVVRRVL